MKFVFIKLPAFFILSIGLAVAGQRALVDPLPWGGAAFIVFVLPVIWRKFNESRQQQRWAREAALSQMQREYAEETAHQTALRRERERLEMQMELRIKELLATLEVQHKLDGMKLQQLQTMKQEFADRQHADLATLLGRLEAMKAG